MVKKSKDDRGHIRKSRKELKKIKALRVNAKNGVPGAAAELEMIRQARILRNVVSSPLEQVKMEPKFF